MTEIRPPLLVRAHVDVVRGLRDPVQLHQRAVQSLGVAYDAAEPPHCVADGTLHWPRELVALSDGTVDLVGSLRDHAAGMDGDVPWGGKARGVFARAVAQQEDLGEGVAAGPDG